MAKKIVCLCLALLMVIPMLVACNKDGDAMSNITEEASRYTTTLNMWVITEKPYLTTEEDENASVFDKLERKQALEQAAEVNAAINKITKSKFKTQVNIKYFTAEEYYEALEKAFADNQKYLEENKGAGSNDSTSDVYEDSGSGVPELKYPVAPDFQVDILFIDDYGKYVTYIENGWLAEVQNHLAESGLKLKNYINEVFLRSAMYNDSLYAFPNNHGVGEYVYVVADKEMMDSFGVPAGSSIYDVQFRNYLDSVYSGASGVYPIYSETGKVDVDYTHYWSVDLDTLPGFALQNPDSFSIYGDMLSGEMGLENKNLLADEAYMSMLANKTHYEKTTGYITTDPNADAAIRIVKGGWELKAEYEAAGYEVLIMQSPTIDSDEVFTSMFAIGAYTTNESRAAEIITYLNTNIEFRNLFQYGIENVNYVVKSVEKNGVLYSYVEPTKDNAYLMDVSKTGNEFIAYPSDPDKVEQAYFDKQQNLEMTRYPTVTFNFPKTYTLDTKSVLIVDAVSGAMKSYLDGLTTSAQVMAVYADALRATDTTKLAAMLLSYVGDSVQYVFEEATLTVNAADLKAALDVMQTSAINPAPNATQSPYAIYYEWAVENLYIKKDEAES